jgi:flagellar biosynthesis chaperone FliJ
MPHDPLETVLRLRRRAVDDARCELVGRVGLASQASAEAVMAEQAIHEEIERASDPAGEDSLVDALAAWLPGARQRVTDARMRHDRAEAEVARCRANLAVTRTALESIEQLQRERRAAVEQARAHRDQLELDETASRRSQQN